MHKPMPTDAYTNMTHTYRHTRTHTHLCSIPWGVIYESLICNRLTSLSSLSDELLEEEEEEEDEEEELDACIGNRNRQRLVAST